MESIDQRTWKLRGSYGTVEYSSTDAHSPVVRLYVNPREGNSFFPIINKQMKRLFLILFAALSIVSCKDEERVTLYEDMMYFTNKLSPDEVYISPVTALDANVNSQLSLHVVRNAFAAKDYPQQSVQIVVDRNLTTAEQGVDFSVSETNLTFNNENNTAAPLSVDIHSGAGKIIALQLVYDYHAASPAASRKADRLTIRIK